MVTVGGSLSFVIKEPHMPFAILNSLSPCTPAKLHTVPSRANDWGLHNREVTMDKLMWWRWWHTTLPVDGIKTWSAQTWRKQPTILVFWSLVSHKNSSSHACVWWKVIHVHDKALLVNTPAGKPATMARSFEQQHYNSPFSLLSSSWWQREKECFFFSALLVHFMQVSNASFIYLNT